MIVCAIGKTYFLFCFSMVPSIICFWRSFLVNGYFVVNCRRWRKLCKHEVQKVREARQLKKAIFQTNFVDREKERPAIRPRDLLSLLPSKGDGCDEAIVRYCKFPSSSCVLISLWSLFHMFSFQSQFIGEDHPSANDIKVIYMQICIWILILVTVSQRSSRNFSYITKLDLFLLTSLSHIWFCRGRSKKQGEENLAVSNIVNISDGLDCVSANTDLNTSSRRSRRVSSGYITKSWPSINYIYHYACSLFCAILAFADVDQKSILKGIILLCLMISMLHPAPLAVPERGNLLLATM